jgi:hypothetical protein
MPSPPENAWAHVVMVYAASLAQMTISVNNVPISCYAGLHAFGPSTGGQFQVASYGTIFPFSGALDEIAVYDYALTPGRVRAHYLKGKGP